MYGCEVMSDDGVQYLMDAMMSNTRVKMLRLIEKYKNLIVPQELVGRIKYRMQFVCEMHRMMSSIDHVM